jgi:hypothetical protein
MVIQCLKLHSGVETMLAECDKRQDWAAVNKMLDSNVFSKCFQYNLLQFGRCI